MKKLLLTIVSLGLLSSSVFAGQLRGDCAAVVARIGISNKYANQDLGAFSTARVTTVSRTDLADVFIYSEDGATSQKIKLQNSLLGNKCTVVPLDSNNLVQEYKWRISVPNAKGYCTVEGIVQDAGWAAPVSFKLKGICIYPTFDTVTRAKMRVQHALDRLSPDYESSLLSDADPVEFFAVMNLIKLIPIN